MKTGVRMSSIVTAVAVALAAASLGAETPQESVHQHGHEVMPFDMAATLHVFRMTESGGEMRVVVRDSKATDQVAMIRMHLGHEAAKFARGDYSDPMALHGADMPGVADLAAGAAKIHVAYREVEDGGAITFTTDDLHLLTAVHRWFGAQLSEHGADARAE